MRLSLDYYGAQDGAQAIEEIVVCGPGLGHPRRSAPGSSRNSVMRFASVSRRPSTGLDAAEAARLTVPYGLALEE